MSNRSYLVSQPKSKLFSIIEQLLNATELSPITFGVLLPLKLRCEIPTNSQNSPGISYKNNNSKVCTIKYYEIVMLVHKTMMANDYRIPCNSTSVRNPQANAVVERVHQTIGNIICTFNIHQTDLDNENPWEGILSSTMFAIRSTVHTTT